MRCLLIGDDQFLDCIIAKELLLAGWEVALLDLNEPIEEIAEDVIHIVGNMENIDAKAGEIAYFKPETVVHLSARNSKDIENIRKICEASASHFVVASSSNVYKANGLVYQTEMGDLDNTPITESALLRSEPLGDASGDRLKVESHLAKSPVPHTILRSPPIYGPKDNLYRLLPLISRMLDKRPFIVVSENQAGWKWTHGYSEDIAHGIALAAMKSTESNRVFNIGENKAPSILERIDHLATVFGWDGDVVALPNENLPPHIVPKGNFDQNLELDSSKIRSEIGYKEVVDYYDGLYETIEWYQKNLPAKYRESKFNYQSEDALRPLVDRALHSR